VSEDGGFLKCFGPSPLRDGCLRFFAKNLVPELDSLRQRPGQETVGPTPPNVCFRPRFPPLLFFYDKQGRDSRSLDNVAASLSSFRMRAVILGKIVWSFPLSLVVPLIYLVSPLHFVVFFLYEHLADQASIEMSKDPALIPIPPPFDLD